MKKNFFEFRQKISYEKALRYQSFLSSEAYSGLFAFECEETITLGLAASRQDILISDEMLKQRKVQVVATDRGGKVSWHGPGQLVGFPIVNLYEKYGDARAVKRFCEELLLELAHACAALGVKKVETGVKFPGLWTPRGKLASLGVAIKDGHVFHGFAINVKMHCLAGYNLINPCGQANAPMTCLEQEGVRISSMEDFAIALLPYLSCLFSVNNLEQSKVTAYERSYANLVSTVSRSQMAIDHLRTKLPSSRHVE